MTITLFTERMSVPKLYYFDARGLVEPIRILLADAGVKYQFEGLGLTKDGVQPKAFLDLKATGVCFLLFFLSFCRFFSF